jgi:hypothetical protein
MLRQARGQSLTLVGERTNCPIPSAHERPWTRPWWQPSEGNGPVLFYIALIHAGMTRACQGWPARGFFWLSYYC